MTRGVSLWGRRPPPVGGVSKSAVLTERALTARGVPTEFFDTGAPGRSVATATLCALQGRRREVAVLNLSTLRGVALLVACGLLSARRVVAYFHGGSFPGRWLRLDPVRRLVVRAACRRLTAAWVTNADLAAWLAHVAPGVPRRIVSPFPSAVEPPPPAGERARSAAVFAFRADPLYGVPLAIDAVRLLRDNGTEWSLDVVLYGSDTATLHRAAEPFRDEPWVRVSVNLTDDAVDALLRRTAVLLRPTSVDGDALVVRQAIAAGCRVVATDAAPRPAGVEIAERSPWAFAGAIENGAPRSDGTGLGIPVDEAIVDVLVG